MEVVGGAEDGVVGIAYVAPEAVAAPGGGDELHRPLGPGAAVVAQTVEPRLHVVDRRQHPGGDVEAALRPAVVVEEQPRRQGATRLEPAPPRRRAETEEIAQGGG